MRSCSASWSVPFLVVLVAPVLQCLAAPADLSSRGTTRCFDEAAAASGCNPGNSTATATSVIQCLCSNADFLDTTAKCVGGSDENSLTAVYTTLSKNCAAAGSEIAVSEEAFVAAGQTTTKGDTSDLLERQTFDAYSHQQQTDQSGSSSFSQSQGDSSSNGQSSQSNSQDSSNGQTGTSSSSQTTTSSSHSSQASESDAADDKPADSSGIPLGVKIGIIAGCVIGSLAIVLPTFYICLHRIRRRKERTAVAAKDPNAGSAENLTLDTMRERRDPSRAGTSPHSAASAVPPSNYQWTLPTPVSQPSMSSNSNATSMHTPSNIYSASRPSMSSLHTTYALGRAAPSSSTQMAAPLPMRASPQTSEGTWAAAIDTRFTGTNTWDTISPSTQMTYSPQRMEPNPISPDQPAIAELPANDEDVSRRGTIIGGELPVPTPVPVSAPVPRVPTGFDPDMQISRVEQPPPRYSAHGFSGETGEVRKDGPGVRD